MYYFDHSATTPADPEVIRVMAEAMEQYPGNPSSAHRAGKAARKALLEARNRVAVLLGAEPGDWDHRGEIVFTGSGTESDNLAILGCARARAGRGRHLITSTIEHHAVLHAFRQLETEGFLVQYLEPDENGIVSLEALRASLRPDTTLVSIMMANNETGALQPVREMARLARENGSLFHTDAVQAAGKIPLDVRDLGVDLLSISAHKFYGPRGTGALYVRKGTDILPVQYGGGQEEDLRPGTENLAGILGLATALEKAVRLIPEEMPRQDSLIRLLEDRLLDKIPHIRINGHRDHRVPGILNFSVEFVEGEAFLMHLDLAGIQASSGSACTTGSSEPSHVLTSMGLNARLAQSSVRISIGKGTGREDIAYLVEKVPAIVDRLRNISPLYRAWLRENPNG